jgi:hypothetical protein
VHRDQPRRQELSRPEPGYLEGGLRDYAPRPPVFVLYRRDDGGCERVVDLFSRRKLAEGVRDDECEQGGDDPGRYRIEERPVYVASGSL